MLYKAGSFVMRCCGRRICQFPNGAASAVESEATRPLLDGYEESIPTINSSSEYSASAGGPDFDHMTADEIYEWATNENGSEATFERSESNALYTDAERQNNVLSHSQADILEVYKIRKITKFNRLTIFDSVIRIGDFMKIGKIQDNKLVPLLSFSPGIQFRYFIDKDNAIIIKGFTTNDESTWDANHVVLGNVFKEHLQNNYVLKTELPDDLINETQLTTKLNDYTLKEDLTDYRKTTDLEYSYEKHLTVINELAVLEPYESGYTYIIRTERGEFEFKDAEEHDKWVIVKPNKIIEWLSEFDEIIMIYWYSQSYNPNQTFVALASDYTQHNITQIKEVICRKEDKIVLKSEIPDDLINETTLATTLNDYALKTDLDEYQLKSNTTITHYCPIEESINLIDDFIIGTPVYLTGKVYKYVDNKFITSMEDDTTDCICSVKTNGKWNEYVGICVKIDKQNKCVTFATHGDYLVKVTDTSCYGIGDEVFIDNGELKTLTGQTAITSKIRRTTVGIITAKINETILSVFKA